MTRVTLVCERGPSLHAQLGISRALYLIERSSAQQEHSFSAQQNGGVVVIAILTFSTRNLFRQGSGLHPDGLDPGSETGGGGSLLASISEVELSEWVSGEGDW